MEHEMDDWALLRDYSEAAFAELVQRHAGPRLFLRVAPAGGPHRFRETVLNDQKTPRVTRFPQFHEPLIWRFTIKG